jgi:hypothetical protein
MSTLVDQIRAIEKSLLGANCLSERMVEGIAKQARHVQREADRVWLEGQIRNHRKLMDMPKGLPPLKPSVPRHGATIGRDLRPAVAERIEVAIRFENRPLWKPVPPNKVAFILKVNGRIWEVVLPEREMRQALEVMEDHNSWIGVVRGFLGADIEGGFAVENAMINVYLKPRL